MPPLFTQMVRLFLVSASPLLVVSVCKWCVCVCIVVPYQNTGNAKQFQLHRCVGQKAGDFYELSGSVTASFHVVLMVLSRKKNGKLKTHTHTQHRKGREGEKRVKSENRSATL